MCQPERSAFHVLSWVFLLLPRRRAESRSRGLICSCEGGARLLEIDDFAVEAELVKITAGSLDPAGIGDAAHLQRVEAGGANQTLDRGRAGVVVGGVEE